MLRMWMLRRGGQGLILWMGICADLYGGLLPSQSLSKGYPAGVPSHFYATPYSVSYSHNASNPKRLFLQEGIIDLRLSTPLLYELHQDNGHFLGRRCAPLTSWPKGEDFLSFLLSCEQPAQIDMNNPFYQRFPTDPSNPDHKSRHIIILNLLADLFRMQLPHINPNLLRTCVENYGVRAQGNQEAMWCAQFFLSFPKSPAPSQPEKPQKTQESPFSLNFVIDLIKGVLLKKI